MVTPFRIVFLCLLAGGPRIGLAQLIESPTETSHSDLVIQLENCRAGLVDPGARASDRIRWAETLFSIDAPQARAMITELLGNDAEPAAQRALCDVMADPARRARLHPEFIDPVLRLLASDSEELRAAASRALARISGTEVPARLGALAFDTNIPLSQRLAAIDALAAQIDRREVVQELIRLLDSDVPDVRARASTALAAAARVNHGADIEQWKKWWAGKSLLSQEAWLADRVVLYRDLWQIAELERATAQKEHRRRLEALAARMTAFQSDAFRALTSDQQESRLVEWLEDPIPEVRLGALSLIQSRIGDEGKRPAEAVQAALLRMLKDAHPAVRRDVLLILQTLKDPVVVKGIMGQLDVEQDVTIRAGLFKALGMSERIEVVPALLKEITAGNMEGGCAREAAYALAQIAPRIEAPESRSQIAQTLSEQYGKVDPADTASRAALLAAMVGVADPVLAPEFLAALDSQDSGIVRTGIRGLRALRNSEKLPRIRTLMGDANALVRAAATEAVGAMGMEDVDLESLLARVNPATESDDLVREAAWKGLRELLSKRSPAERLRAVDRLRDLPELELRYLEELASSLTDSNGDGLTLASVCERLARALTAAQRFDEAAVHWRRVFELRSHQNDPEMLNTGIHWLESALRSRRETDLARVIAQITSTSGSESAPRIVEAVSQRLTAPEVVADPEYARSLLDRLAQVPPESLGAEWNQLLQQAETRVTAAQHGPPMVTP